MEVLLGAHPQRPLGLVVVPGEDVAAAVATERHGEHEDRDGLARPALGVDDGDLAQAAEVAADRLDRPLAGTLARAGRQGDHAEAEAVERTAQAGLGHGRARRHDAAGREVVGGDPDAFERPRMVGEHRGRATARDWTGRVARRSGVVGLTGTGQPSADWNGAAGASKTTSEWSSAAGIAVAGGGGALGMWSRWRGLWITSGPASDWRSACAEASYCRFTSEGGWCCSWSALGGAP